MRYKFWQFLDTHVSHGKFSRFFPGRLCDKICDKFDYVVIEEFE